MYHKLVKIVVDLFKPSYKLSPRMIIKPVFLLLQENDFDDIGVKKYLISNECLFILTYSSQLLKWSL